jgi:hypothetical protein
MPLKPCVSRHAQHARRSAALIGPTDWQHTTTRGGRTDSACQKKGSYDRHRPEYARRTTYLRCSDEASDIAASAPSGQVNFTLAACTGLSACPA